MFRCNTTKCNRSGDDDDDDDEATATFYVPYECDFYTYEPQLLSSVMCQSATCKLSRTVTTVDTYSPTEGYNWGVKIYGKASFLDFLEVGGELGTGGDYSCTYTKGKTVADLVECSSNEGVNGHLSLYTVKSDMRCKFGTVNFHLDWDRSSGGGIDVSTNTFSQRDVDKVNRAKLELDFTSCFMTMFMIDMDKISEGLLDKLTRALPHYNPMTDVITMYNGGGGSDYNAVVMYLKRGSSELDVTTVIPFTNEAGDSVYQYACIMF